ncbi:NifX-associated nitrogen fixation protein [Gynuella sp.]|uniref:NifX-associated nitrogen fixation protein n=1 Tax=Gynuella sp. TaxID=2969146 RepID=UPI003D1273E4
MTEFVEKLEVADNDPALKLSFIRGIITQLRAMDTYGTYDTWNDARVIDPLVLTKERRRDIPVVGDPDEVVISRIKAYYNAIAAGIEVESQLMAMPVINLSHEGFGRALIKVGKLVVVDKTLRDVHRFGFDSLEQLAEEGSTLISDAAALIQQHRQVAEL